MKLKNILHYIGLLFFFISSLLGGLLKGYDPLVALPISLVLTIVVFFLVRLMINKKKETHTKIIETLSHWLIYIVIMVAGGIASLHFITVQFIASDDLEISGNEKLNTINNITTDFQNQVENTKDELFQEIQRKLNEYGNAGRKMRKKKAELKVELINIYKIDENDLDKNVKNRIRDLTKTTIKDNFSKKIEEFSDKIDTRLGNYSIENVDVFNNMESNYLKVNRVYYELDTLLKNNKERLVDGFNKVVSNFGKDVDVFNDLNIPESSVSLNNFTKLREQYPPWKYLLGYLLLHLLIISPLLLAWREGKKPLSEKDIYTNEL